MDEVRSTDIGVDSTIDRSRIDAIINRLYSPDSDYVQVAVHRGDWHNYPENTLAALQSCIDMGVEIIEIDVRRTADGELAIIHDTELDRTTNGSGKVADFTMAEIRKLRTKTNDGELTDYPVPSLADVMLAAKGKAIIMIDKGNDHFPKIREVLLETKTMDHALFVEPYSYPTAKEEMGPVLLERAHHVPRVTEDLEDPQVFKRTFTERMSVAAFEYRLKQKDSPVLTAIDQQQSVWITTINPDMCSGHDDALSLENPDAGWGWCVEQGATILLTDYPKEMIQYLQTNRLR